MVEDIDLKKKKKTKKKLTHLAQDNQDENIDNILVTSLTGETPLFILFEHAIGYALFSVKQFEEIGNSLLSDQLRDNLSDFTKFCSMVHLIAFSPFKSAINALENINYISEGMIHENLYLFLDSYLPKKIGKLILGVSDSKLAASLNENKELNINSIYSGLIPEVVRGIRQHFPKYFKDFKNIKSETSIEIDDSKEGKAQLGLAHSYSRAKIKFNVNRVDNMIIQCIAILDQLDKDVNKFCMRLREWYSYHFPELYKIVPDNLLYSRVVKCLGDRKTLFHGNAADKIIAKREELVQVLPHDTEKVEMIEKAAKSSMGMDISPLDLNMVIRFAVRVIALGELRKNLASYLNQKMKLIAPNLAELLGDTISARLISHAGSLSNLAKCPASTIQILGAEKALFRALKSRSGNTPKYGLLFHSSFISKAGPTNKGKVSRYLANKCAIASRIDCYSDVACPVYGQFLKAQIENRIKFLESGVEPIRNDDLMIQAKAKVQEYIENSKNEETPKKIKKKKKKSGLVTIKSEESITSSVTLAESLDLLENENNVSSKVKKKKKRKFENMNGDTADDDELLLNGTEFMVTTINEFDRNSKKSITSTISTSTTYISTDEVQQVSPKKKKKKKDKEQLSV